MNHRIKRLVTGGEPPRGGQRVAYELCDLLPKDPDPKARILRAENARRMAASGPVRV